MRFDDESDGTTAPRLSRPKHSQSRGRNFVQSLIMSVTLVAIIALLVYSSLAVHCSAAAPPEEFVIAGYLPDYRSYIDADRGSVHLTDLIVFSLSPRTVLKYEGGVPRDGCCLEGRHFDQARGAREFKLGTRGTNVRLLVSVGGAGRAEGFKDIAANQREFLLGLAKVCRNERLDGVDLDLEGISSLEEWDAYERFIGKAAGYLHSIGLVLSVAPMVGMYWVANLEGSLKGSELVVYRHSFWEIS
mmetsp:Transcript_4170/g.9330  ORF Transcript_4170/g.9330 Transcript_4170/m.9330 type:complete len:245 (+) Transcript_4170:212-946(+)